MRRRVAVCRDLPVVCGGFTLLELILVLVILGVIGLIAARFLGGAMEAVFLTREATNTQMEVGAALDRMARDVRAAQNIAECSPGTLTLALEDGGQRHYYLADGRVWLEANGDSALLAGDADDPVAAFACDDSAPWQTFDVVALTLGTVSGYEALTHAYRRS
ncbi:MAG: prepilin-type N-terminal cleavage/methylation domain-containing protein [Pseudomonadota bacterium]